MVIPSQHTAKPHLNPFLFSFLLSFLPFYYHSAILNSAIVVGITFILTFVFFLTALTTLAMGTFAPPPARAPVEIKQENFDTLPVSPEKDPAAGLVTVPLDEEKTDSLAWVEGGSHLELGHRQGASPTNPPRSATF